MRRPVPRNPNQNPGVSPVLQVEVSSHRWGLRLVAFLVFLLIGISAITYAVTSWINSGTGWQQISVSSSAECPDGGDFTFLCNLGSKGSVARQRRRALTELYTAALSRVAALFDAEDPRDGKSDLYRLNHSVGEEITVDPDFYRALYEALADGCRDLFFGPVIAYYEVLYSITDNDTLAASQDPMRNEALYAKVRQIIAFAEDPNSVSVTLFDDYRVKLIVSDEYKTFAEANAIVNYVDFFGMKNAWITDLVAEELIAEGATDGFLSSFDGFSRTLGKSGAYEFSLYDLIAGRATKIATLASGGEPKSVVRFCSFPITAYEANFRAYLYADGELRFGWLDSTDGRLKAAATNLTVYSGALSCAELLLRSKSAYAADAVSETKLAELSSDGVYYILHDGTTIRYNEPSATIVEIVSDYNVE